MKTKRFKGSSGHESALNSSRLNPTAALSGNSAKPLAHQPFQRQRQQGIALVITLILLSVTLVMAVAFLAISRRGRVAVTTTEDTATAKFAADAALAKAEARIVSQILTTTNPYVFSLVVSTNYVNYYGFNPDEDNNPTNVNYDYYGPPKSGPLSAQDLEYNIANLYYDPRPPVFYSNDFRFYLDLNRNGMYETNGRVEDVANSGQPILNDSGETNYSWQIGDPEWIGILAHPDQPHGPNNPFIARYCFIAVPANSLDLNYIHNQAFSASSTVNNLSVNNDGYFRNQGVGTWELNMAAFLADLNTNIWDPLQFNGYQYLQPVRANTGFAFSDAFDLLTNRYASFYPSQATVQNLFGANGVNAFEYNGIDAYTMGPLQTTFDINYAPETYYNYFWVGAQNTNNFFTLDDLFNTNKTSNFAIHLQNAGVNTANAEGTAGTTVSTYDRYTFYRMLAQLGTDTKPASGKINLNYQNAIVTYDLGRADQTTYGPAVRNVALNITMVPNMETNFLPWAPQDFFTVAADRLLRTYTAQWFEESPSNYIQTYYGIPFGYSYTNFNGLNVTNIQYYGQTNQIPAFGITNIPVYMNGSFVYTPAVNRLLQLAANIYDATTNTSTTVNSNYPSVFRPVFYAAYEYNYFLRQYFTNVYIKGYQYIGGPVPDGIYNPIFNAPEEVSALPLGYSTNNVWGVPWILGAKKGLPNLNQLEVVNSYFIERLLQMQKKTVDPATMYATNQMYIMSITNYYGDMDFNSYAENYNNPVAIVARQNVSVAMTWTNDSEIPPVNNPGKGSTFINAFFSYTNIGVPPAWPALSSQMMFGTNAYSFTFSIPGASVLQGNSFQTAEMNSANPLFLNFVTNSAYVYYYGPNAVTLPSGWGPSYTFNPPCFIPTFLDPSNYLDSGTPPLPQMTLWVTNRLQAYMIDSTSTTGSPSAGSTGHILDYVQLGGMNNSLNVNQAVADNSIIQAAGGQGYTTGMWSTNFYPGTTTPYGVNAQYLTSLGSENSVYPQFGVPPEDLDGGKWTASPVTGASGKVYTDTAAQQAFFQAFISPTHLANYYVGGNPNSGAADVISNFETSIQLPFTPTRKIVQRYVYEANDPLVHYMASDLFDFPDTTNGFNLDNPPLLKLVSQNDRYMPWGTLGNLARATLNNVPADNNAENLSYKDPMVLSPDNWDFPTNKYPTVGWLGRVHRGTPWQTVYLKSSDILYQTEGVGNQTLNVGVPTWQLWTGNVYNPYDAVNTAPDQDRLLFDLFTAAPDDDATRGQLSVNVGADDPYHDPLDGLASWSALLSGTLAFSNNANGFTFGFGGTPAQNPDPNLSQTAPAWVVMTNQPLGAPPIGGYPGGYMTNVAMYQIVAGINSARTNYGAFPNADGLQGVYEHAGDILRVPQLSVQSPFLNPQVSADISDEMYEWLPQQILGLVNVSGTSQNPPRYVVYCYGQTLKPAPNGIVSSGTFAGLCTNYQVTAESASRVVIEVQNAPTPANPTAAPHVVIEQYNTLPPD